jgi:putative solute:sodium symporter small subunit
MAESPTPNIDRVTYWHTQIRRTALLLAVWFVAGFVLSIFLAEPLNGFRFGGIPFGFWMAQQGSIFVFVSLVFIYTITSNRLDREAGVEETEDTTSSAGEAH